MAEEEGFRVQPATWSDETKHITEATLDGAAILKACCEVCGNEEENWVCLT